MALSLFIIIQVQTHLGESTERADITIIVITIIVITIIVITIIPGADSLG